MEKCDCYDNPKVKLKEGVNKTNLKQLELQFVAIDKNANECGLTSDAKTSFRKIKKTSFKTKRSKTQNKPRSYTIHGRSGET